VKRPLLEKAIDTLGPGDVLVLAEWDRATRSMLDGIRVIERVAARGATLKALDRQWLDLITPLGNGILAFLSALTEDDRTRILARANGGRAAAKKRGVKFGPKPKLALPPESRGGSHGPRVGIEPPCRCSPLPCRPFNYRSGTATDWLGHLTRLGVVRKVMQVRLCKRGGAHYPGRRNDRDRL